MAYMTQQLGLSRSTLLSLLVMVSTVAIFATGATFALTTSDSASGTVKAGTFAVNLAVNGTGLDGALAFSTGNVRCPSTLQPGDSCTATVNVQNTSGFPLILAQPTSSPVGTADTIDSVDPVGCLDSHWPVEFDTTTNLYEINLPAGATTSFVVRVTLAANAPLGCSGETATVLVTVAAST